jgi:hypothetical protein
MRPGLEQGLEDDEEQSPSPELANLFSYTVVSDDE